jgi:hypothetical protein
MSPAVAPTQPAQTTTQAAKPAEAAKAVAPVLITVPCTPGVGCESTRTHATHAQPSTVAMPRLKDGKSIPGPDEWRTLERRALSFRLRGRDGAIGS